MPASRPTPRGSNNTISRVYRELRALETMVPYSPCATAHPLSPSLFLSSSIRLDLTAIEQFPKRERQLVNKRLYRLRIYLR